ncbi:GNAT family N-acetyltransferase [Candidatus Gottesmanbacteria bacterium]|nr:GNAT family N-acetyltransferase [Candidatus Gottesmanbacteria bacterium]
MVTYKITAGLETYLNEWNRLIENSHTATVFQTPEYLLSWRESFVSQKEVLLISIFEDLEVIGIAVFRKQADKATLLGTDRIGLGGDLVTDFGDIIAKEGKEKEIWKEVLLALGKNGIKEVVLDYIRQTSPSFTALTKLGHSHEEMLDNAIPDVSPSLDLPKTFNDYLNLLERKNRHELQRKLRRLENTGYDIRVSAKATDITEFIRLHKASTLTKDRFMNSEMVNFFTKIAKGLFSKGFIDLVFMEVEGKSVASTLSFLWKREYWLYNSGFDRNYKDLAVGLLLKGLTIKRAIDLGYNKYNFLRGNERYKYDLGAIDEKLYKIIIQF